jgi:Homeodomain-like domain
VHPVSASCAICLRSRLSSPLMSSFQVRSVNLWVAAINQPPCYHDRVEDNESHLLRIGAELAANRKENTAILRRARKYAAIYVEAGLSQRRAAELLGVDRMTVRKWVGKR